jgi:uncharacterized protein
VTQVFCCTLRVDLHIPGCNSLKAKRAVVRPLLDGIRNRFPASVAEVGMQDVWTRSVVAVAVVSGAEHVTQHALDEIERFVWSWPEIEVVTCQRAWLDDLEFEND